MKNHKRVLVRWQYPIKSVYEFGYKQISQPLILNDGIVALDGANLIKLDFEGNLIWRCSCNGWFWGSPVAWRFNWIVCADGSNKIHFVDSAGQIAKTIYLSTSITTDIVVGESGDLWFGMGAAYCAITRIDVKGNIVYSKQITRDNGLRYSPAIAADGSLWIAADDGLIRVKADSGETLFKNENDSTRLICLSGALPVIDGALVVADLPENSQAIVKVSNDGSIIHQYSFPNIWRAQLLRGSLTNLWFAGSTVSSWDSVNSSDRTFVAQLTSDGKPILVRESPAQRAINAKVDSQNCLWLGTYTQKDDDTEIGELLIYDSNADLCATWSPEIAAGVSAPTFISKNSGVFCTSKAIVSFTYCDEQGL